MMKIITFINQTVKPKLADLTGLWRKNGQYLETGLINYIVAKKGKSQCRECGFLSDIDHEDAVWWIFLGFGRTSKTIRLRIWSA
jgi:hypothetical protein